MWPSHSLDTSDLAILTESMLNKMQYVTWNVTNFVDGSCRIIMSYHKHMVVHIPTVITMTRSQITL
jgi:hypothetical protein